MILEPLLKLSRDFDSSRTLPPKEDSTASAVHSSKAAWKPLHQRSQAARLMFRRVTASNSASVDSTVDLPTCRPAQTTRKRA